MGVSTGAGPVDAELALGRLIGRSPAIRDIRSRIRQIARSHVPVLILGETGTGKEVCASALFTLSGCRRLVPVNCAAIPESLIDSELFGHASGAFTGATRAREGLIAHADRGMLFLDELAEVSPAVQAKLLRTLETGEYRPVGSNQTNRSDFRIVAATHGDMHRLVLAGRLRADLMHRLGALRIVLPPLRERPEDIPLLVDTFLAAYRERHGSGPIHVAANALSLLESQEWKGNVRELRNVVEAAATLAGTSATVARQDVAAVLGPFEEHALPIDNVPRLAVVRRQAEDRAVAEALRLTDQNRRKAAKLLGISEAKIYRHIAKTPAESGEQAGRGTVRRRKGRADSRQPGER